MKSILCIISIILVLGACQVATVDHASQLCSAAFVIRYTYPGATKTIVPPLDMQISHFIITGAGPEGASIDPPVQSSDENVTVDDLVPGDWSFTVDAYNGAGVHIASGWIELNANLFKFYLAMQSRKQRHKFFKADICIFPGADFLNH